MASRDDLVSPPNGAAEGPCPPVQQFPGRPHPDGIASPGQAAAGPPQQVRDLSSGGLPAALVSQAAFYGRTNAAGVDAATILTRQFLRCQEATAGQAVITQIFCDAAGAVSPLLQHALYVHAPLARSCGGWDDLAAEITSRRAFRVIVCQAPDRFSRRPAVLDARLGLVARHGVAVLFADEPGWGSALLEVTRGLTGAARALQSITHLSGDAREW